MSDQAPSPGRIVHYVSRGSADGKFPSVCRAAVITEIGQSVVSLAVLNPTGLFFDSGVPQGVVQDEPGTWHWPERV